MKQLLSIQPLARAVPGAQVLQQHREKHRVAILAAFALFDMRLTINVTDLQGDHLADAQFCAVGHRRLVS